MATKNDRPTPKKRSAFSFIFTPLGIVVSIFFYLLISIVISTIIEWVGITFFWEKSHAEDVLKQEFAYLGNNFSMTLLGISAEQAALDVISWIKSHIFSFNNSRSGWLVMDWVNTAGQGAQPYINSFFYVVMVTAIRCVIIALSSVMFIVVGLAAMVDGLHRRELRKLCGGVEYGGVYHHAKSWVPRAIIVSPVLYLAWPNAINPNYILLPGMFCFFIAIYISFATYKKYI